MNEIIEKRVIGEDVFKMLVEAPRIAEVRKPGQFIILRVEEGGERIPLTIADSDSERGTITLVIQRVGKTTELLTDKAPGDFISDVAGPLGKPTELIKCAHAVCVGGGVGTAVVYPIAKALAAQGVKVTAIIGGRSRNNVLFEEELGGFCDDVLVTTDDGSYGRKGFVTEVLTEFLSVAEPPVEVVYAVGPVPMMKAVTKETRKLHDIKTIVSLNPIMVDGTGMCGGCRVSVGGRIKFACVDGPEFDAFDVDFDELMDRQSMYKGFEHEAEENCRLDELASKK